MWIHLDLIVPISSCRFRTVENPNFIDCFSCSVFLIKFLIFSSVSAKSSGSGSCSPSVDFFIINCNLIYPSRSKRGRLRSENGPWMLSKRRLYDHIPCKYGPFSVRIYPYDRAQKYVPYVAVFPAFTDEIRPAVL